jgi:hypothetical protein
LPNRFLPPELRCTDVRVRLGHFMAGGGGWLPARSTATLIIVELSSQVNDPPVVTTKWPQESLTFVP